MTNILIIKTGALGDVLRTTSILRGLRRRYSGCAITWVTAPAAVDLLKGNRDVDEVLALDPSALEAPSAEVERTVRELVGRRWDRVLSFDDELALCALATRAVPRPLAGVLSGAHLDAHGRPTYSADTAAWMEMGLLSKLGKEAADRLKKDNSRSHPEIFADMLGCEMGEPVLHLDAAALAFGERFAERCARERPGLCIGLNTGAGGRWESKKLPVERTLALVAELDARLSGRVCFVLLGGPDEAQRNAAILAGLGAAGAACVDAGTGNRLLEFAAIVNRLDLLVTSDSLGLHVAVACQVPVVCFFAPTSAAEIELYGRGEKVVSTAPDYCSYRSDADTTTLTVERLRDAVLRTLERPADPVAPLHRGDRGTGGDAPP